VRHFSVTWPLVQTGLVRIGSALCLCNTRGRRASAFILRYPISAGLDVAVRFDQRIPGSEMVVLERSGHGTRLRG